MGAPEVVLERSGSIARVILNRPERRNALGVRKLPALNEMLDAIEAGRDIGVVILTGRGPVFCGGGDLDEIMSPKRTDREWEFGFIRGYNRVVRRLRQLDPPVIAAVNGPAVGGGAALAMACDIAIAAESARYDFVFERIGLASADMGCTYLLPRIVGPVRASYLLLTGGSVSAREGLALGLFADVVPDRALDETAMRVAERIAAGPRRASFISKLALRRGESLDLDTAELESQWQKRIEGARYEAEKAARRYHQVEPENRLVARTLEGEWNERLAELDELERRYAEARRKPPFELTTEQREKILALAEDLPRLWRAPTTRNGQRKQIVTASHRRRDAS